MENITTLPGLHKQSAIEIEKQKLNKGTVSDTRKHAASTSTSSAFEINDDELMNTSAPYEKHASSAAHPDERRQTLSESKQHTSADKQKRYENEHKKLKLEQRRREKMIKEEKKVKFEIKEIELKLSRGDFRQKDSEKKT